MDKGAKDKLARAPGENGRRQDAQKDLQTTNGRDETERKTQKKMERASRRRSASARSEKMERDSDRQKQMEGHCSTGQGSQRAVVPMEEKEEEEEEEEKSLCWYSCYIDVMQMIHRTNVECTRF